MTISTIRTKLYDYIRVADDKKIQAIFNLLEDDIVHETDWWKNEAVVREFKSRLDKWESGEEEAFSLSDIEQELLKLKIGNK